MSHVRRADRAKIHALVGSSRRILRLLLQALALRSLGGSLALLSLDTSFDASDILELTHDPFAEDAEGGECSTEDGRDVLSEREGVVRLRGVVGSEELVRFEGADGEEDAVEGEDMQKDVGFEVDAGGDAGGAAGGGGDARGGRGGLLACAAEEVESASILLTAELCTAPDRKTRAFHRAHKLVITALTMVSEVRSRFSTAVLKRS